MGRNCAGSMSGLTELVVSDSGKMGGLNNGSPVTKLGVASRGDNGVVKDGGFARRVSENDGNIYEASPDFYGRQRQWRFKTICLGKEKENVPVPCP
jgi:hypothetical protein